MPRIPASNDSRKPSPSSIKAQLERPREEGEAENLIAVLRERIRVLENVARASRWDTTSQNLAVREQRMAHLMSAIEGEATPSEEAIRLVYRNGGHFLLRFAKGVMLLIEDPDEAIRFLRRPETSRPTSWICVDHKGHIVPLYTLKQHTQ